MPTAALTDQDYTATGRRHGSDAVAKEASEVSSRWTRDLAVLAPYGHGTAVLAAFEADRTAHQALRAARPEAVATKSVSVKDRDGRVSAGWAWVDQVVSILGVPARSDAKLAEALDKAHPATDPGLDAGIGALAKLLEEHKAKVGADAEADARIAEAPAIRAAVAAVGTISQKRSVSIPEEPSIRSPMLAALTVAA